MIRLSSAFLPTLREAPADAAPPGFAQLVRGGFVRPLSPGLVQLLPMGVRVERRLARLVSTALEARGAEPWAPPVTLPVDLARRAGRETTLDAATPRWQDRAGRHLALPAGSAIAALDVAAGLVRSYRQLPRLWWTERIRWRDREHCGPGLFALREARVLEAVALEADGAALAARLEDLEGGLRQALTRAGLPPLVGPADPLDHGGARARGMWIPHPQGPETLLVCDGCGAVAGQDVLARGGAEEGGAPSPPAHEAGEAREVATPECTTIEDVARFLEVPVEATAKAVFFADEADRLLFAVVRGDEVVAPPKLAAWAGARALRPAREDEIRAAGAEPGYASPVGISPDCRVVVSPGVAAAGGLVGGANRPGYHLRDLTFGRDYQGTVADIARVRPADPCPACGARELGPVAAVPVAGLVDLEDAADALGARVQPEAGKPAAPHAALAWVDLGASLGALAERRVPAEGARPRAWSPSVAPFEVHVVSLAGKDADCLRAAEDLARSLAEAGVIVALDDRTGGAGAKFADAELLGAPVWLVVGTRGFQAGTVELRDQVQGSRRDLPIGDAVERVAALRRAWQGDQAL